MKDWRGYQPSIFERLGPLHTTQSCIIPPPIHELTHTAPPHAHISHLYTHTHTSWPRQTKLWREIRPASPWLTLICSVNTQPLWAHWNSLLGCCRFSTALHTFLQRGGLELWGTLIHTFICVRHHHAGLLPTGLGSADKTRFELSNTIMSVIVEV